MKITVTATRAKDLRAGDVIDTYSGLDFRREGYTRWWRKICSVQVRSEGVEIRFNSGQTLKCTPNYLFDKQVILTVSFSV